MVVLMMKNTVGVGIVQTNGACDPNFLSQLLLAPTIGYTSHHDHPDHPHDHDNAVVV